MRNNVLCYFAPRLGTCVGCITLSSRGNLPTIKTANIQLAFRLSGVFPPSSPSMFVGSNMSNNSPMGRVRTSPFVANLTPNCGTVVLATECKSSAFSAPF